jgi:hypothetical protein
LVLVVVSGDGENRAEDVVAGDVPAVVDVGEDGGLVVPTRIQAGRPPATAFPTSFRRRSVTSGPICVAGSSGSPMVSEPANPARVSTTSSYRLRGARTRVERKQVWPLLISIEPNSA